MIYSRMSLTMARGNALFPNYVKMYAENDDFSCWHFSLNWARNTFEYDTVIQHLNLILTTKLIFTLFLISERNETIMGEEARFEHLTLQQPVLPTTLLSNKKIGTAHNLCHVQIISRESLSSWFHGDFWNRKSNRGRNNRFSQWKQKTSNLWLSSEK